MLSCRKPLTTRQAIYMLYRRASKLNDSLSQNRIKRKEVSRQLTSMQKLITGILLSIQEGGDLSNN